MIDSISVKGTTGEVDVLLLSLVAVVACDVESDDSKSRGADSHAYLLCL